MELESTLATSTSLVERWYSLFGTLKGFCSRDHNDWMTRLTSSIYRGLKNNVLLFGNKRNDDPNPKGKVRRLVYGLPECVTGGIINGESEIVIKCMCNNIVLHTKDFRFRWNV